MNKKVCEAEIDDLFAFCREHNVSHYDLQLELVDHLASAIEKQWEEYPDRSFNDALGVIFGEFGVSGFSKIRKAKEKALQKKYQKLQWKYIGAYFKVPKIIITVAIALVVFTILRITTNNFQISLGFMAATFLFYVYGRNYLYPRKFKLQITHGMTFMLTEFQKTFYRSIINFVYLPMNIFIIVATNRKHHEYSDFTNNVYFELGASFLITLFIITLSVLLIYIPRRIKEDFTSEYPQFIKE